MLAKPTKSIFEIAVIAGILVLSPAIKPFIFKESNVLVASNMGA